jgi:hypothetical protein
MSKEDLIPFNTMNEEQARQIQSLGGRTVSPQKKFSAKIREMKKRGLTDEDVKWFLDRLTDPEVSIFHLEKWIDELRDSIHPNQRIALINAAIALHKAKFGEKQVNLNLNTDLKSDLEKWFKNENDKQE